MYVAVKGGEKAIRAAHDLLAEERRGNPDIPEISIDQIREQLSLAVDRVMTEASLYDRELAALAIKQASGDLIEAIFLLRAYRTTLPRLFVSKPVDTSEMLIQRRISAAFKDLPGGQILGPTFDYTHRLLDFSLAENSEPTPSNQPDIEAVVEESTVMPRVTGLLDEESLIEQDNPEPSDPEPGDITRQPLTFPAGRDVRLQYLSRSDEGFLLSLGYSVQRGYGATHPFVGEIRMGEVSVFVEPEELGFEIEIGTITVSECEMINEFKGSKEIPPQFTRGYGLTFGYCERKAISMALVDRALRGRELEEPLVGPARDEEFVLSHGDNVEAQGFTGHLKLPHHVDFQTNLVMVREMRKHISDDSEADNEQS
jgi:alpha-D-ribose 1-methylphosphonate 5-triphosphate synthase subunit PhnI